MAIHVDDAARRLELGVGDVLPAEEADPFAGRASFARMLAGTRAHVRWAEVRAGEDPGFRREVVVAAELVIDGWVVALQGRVDGLVQDGERNVVEEVKTVVLSRDDFAELRAEHYPAYILQLSLYLFLLAHQDDGIAPAGRLVFINLPGGDMKAIAVELDRELVSAVLTQRVREILALHREESERLTRRRAIGAGLAFAFAEVRPRQAEMVEAARQALDAGECLLVSAPPGLGKTAAALHAALGHALTADRRVFFVTSKTTEQRIVATTLARLVEKNPGITAVVLRAKAKICANEVVFCHPDFCQYARDYPTKVEASGSRERLLGDGLALPDAIYDEGVRARACPFELSLDLSERADVVVGDYNYVFDPSVALRRTFEEGGEGDLVLVIDEAHNLLDRAREYYSPRLDSARVSELLSQVVLRPGEIYRGVEDWLQSLLGWFGKLHAAYAEGEPMADPRGRDLVFIAEREHEAIRRRRTELEDILLAYTAFRRESGGVLPDDPVLDLAYDFLRFARVIELEGDEFAYLFEPRRDGSAVYRVVCLDPSRQLGRRLKSFHGVIAMSATLEPESYYRDLLGFPAARTSSLRLASPFAAANRRILVVPTVTTTFRERARWYDQVSDTVRDLYEAKAGHWIVFFPSFAYLSEIDLRLGRLAGEQMVQSPGMRDAERASILQRLERPDGTPRLLLAVLGGAFAEGIDLPGDALVGVIVVSPGLPQVSVDRELLKRRFDELYGTGFDYAYLVPGLARVIQAAGRLVRSEQDRGVVVLLDRRFASPTYTRLFPQDWYKSSPSELVVRDPALAVAEFFAESEG